MNEEEIKALQDKAKSLEDENKRLLEENKSLKTKNEEQASSIKGIKDDIEKFKAEVRDGFATTQAKLPAQDNKPKSLLEEIKNANRE